MRRLALLGAVVFALGFAVPATIRTHICEKGTVINFNNGDEVCVGRVVEHDRDIDTEEVIATCENTNPRWTGIVELRPRGVIVCY